MKVSDLNVFGTMNVSPSIFIDKMSSETATEREVLNFGRVSIDENELLSQQRNHTLIISILRSLNNRYGYSFYIPCGSRLRCMAPLLG